LSYEQFFSLKEQPFSNAAHSRFYFESVQHQDAMVRIMHSVETMKGLTTVIGNSGTGKTLLARRILEKLEADEQYEAALLVIVHSEITAEWLLKKIATQLGVPNPPERKGEILPLLAQRLTEIYEAGRKAVVLIDEANMLQSREIFEEFRGLSNLEMPGHKLISVVFFGLPELEQSMALDPPLVQRVAVKYTLRPLHRDSTAAYIRHRMGIAGATREIFSEEAINSIFTNSQGVPRLINSLCDNCLLEAYLVKKEIISGGLADDVAADLGLKKKEAV
jgi:type II secretory pathway predicted ATPase ExeA